jgi:hypothetical protein
MIRKGVQRFSEKIVLDQKAKTPGGFDRTLSRFSAPAAGSALVDSAIYFSCRLCKTAQIENRASGIIRF